MSLLDIEEIKDNIKSIINCKTRVLTVMIYTTNADIQLPHDRMF